MKIKTHIVLIILTVTVFLSCSKNEENLTPEPPKSEIDDCINYAESYNDGGGVCLNGERIVSLEQEYQYVFTIGKKNQAENINKEVLWEITSGTMEIMSIDTETKENYTVSYCTVKIPSNFNGGSIKASSNRYEELTNGSVSYVQISVEVDK
jgi:hypothetical protein